VGGDAHRPSLAAYDPPRTLVGAGFDRAGVDGVDRRREFPPFGLPTLVQWGAEDEWLPVEYGKARTAAIPTSQFIAYDSVGHVPMEEAPATTAEDVVVFLSD
jgi:pimeloyl-ACP methyl ester carboxylesterase